jgi:hypothetical protein
MTALCSGNVAYLDHLGPVHLVWGLFHYYASAGDPTRSTSMNSLQFRKFARDAGFLGTTTTVATSAGADAEGDAGGAGSGAGGGAGTGAGGGRDDHTDAGSTVASGTASDGPTMTGATLDLVFMQKSMAARAGHDTLVKTR